MRESIGATFLIKLMVVFIILYNSLLAIAVNYAMVFRVKNQIINLIEQYEGCDGARDYIKDYIANVGYFRATSAKQGPYAVDPIRVSNRGTYYVVTTYLTFDFPMVKNILRVNVSGESKIIYGIYETSSDCKF